MGHSQKGRIITWGDKISAVKKGVPGRRLPIVDRFWSKVTAGEPDECWEWRGALDSTRYGVMSVPTTVAHNTKTYAHRISYELHKGPIPAGLEILHSCDNRPCVNPWHLSVGTRKDNVQDARRKGRLRGRMSR